MNAKGGFLKIVGLGLALSDYDLYFECPILHSNQESHIVSANRGARYVANHTLDLALRSQWR